MQVIFTVTENNRIIVQLDAFIRKYYKNKLIRGSIYTAAVLLSLFLLLVLLEYFGYFPSLVRGILFWCYISMTAVLVCYWVLLPLSKMRRLGKCISYEQAAIIIGDYFPEVKDKLLNLLQLQNMSSVADSDLLSASIKQKTDSLSPIPFKNAIKLNANKKYLKYVVSPLVLIVLLLIFVPSSITGPSKRIVNYDVNYVRPAPFGFVVENDVLESVQQDDYLLRVAIVGDVLPAEVYIETDGLQYKMQPVDKSHFTYLFKQIHATVHFRLRAAGVESDEYVLLVHPKPSVIDFQVSLTFPSYTHQQDLTLSNQGDITVSQGTSVRWIFLTRDVDVFHFISNGTVQDIVPDANGRVVVQHKAMSSFEYEFVASNKNVIATDTLAYAITVVPDALPMIVVAQSDDSTLPDRKFFQGYIKDDYGFSKLLFRIIVNNESDSAVDIRHDYNVVISSEISQEFLFSFDMGNLDLNPGDRVQYYFEIWDNDAIHGPKSATSQQYLLEIPSEHKLKQILDDNTSDAIVHAEQSMSDLKKLQSEINELMRKLVDKNELSWQDKKQLQELATKQKQVKEELSKMQQQLRQNNMLEQKYRDQSQQIMQKQQELDKLLNEVLNDEMKDMMREIDKLMEEIDKNKVQEHLENLKLDNEQLEKQIDQDIELLKRLELEKKVEDAIQKASELSDKQRELAKETENASSKDLEQLKSKQQQLSDQFKELKNDIKEIQQQYKEINEDYNFNVNKQLEDKIDQLQQEAQQKSAKGKRKEASKAQQEAADALQQLSDQLADEQSRIDQEDLAEDAEMVRRLLKNLVALSFSQEKLIPAVSGTYIQDPKYQDIIADQNKIKSDFRGVEDSLQAISSRQVAVASAITKEVSEVNGNIARSLSALLRCNQSFYGGSKNSSASQPMQYAMTSINNLALILAESLDKMQNQMRQNSMRQKGSRNSSSMKKNGSCSNPGKGKPSPKSLKQMQDELNKQMEALKKELEKQGNKPGQGRKKLGEGRQLSEQFAKMAAQQEMIRRMMQEYGQEMKQMDAGNGKLAKEIDEIMRQMEQTETDLVNKTISQQTLTRQQQIMTRLLEHEKAEMQRDQESRRQSQEATDQYQPSPSDLKAYEKLKQQNQDLFRTTPPSLTPYYKSKVTNYFYGLGDF